MDVWCDRIGNDVMREKTRVTEVSKKKVQERRHYSGLDTLKEGKMITSSGGWAGEEVERHVSRREKNLLGNEVENRQETPKYKEDGVYLVRYGYEAEQPRRFRGTPLAARAVRQRHHDGLQLFANDFELAHALELHRLAGQILFGRHRVGEYVQQERAAVGRVHAERHDVSQHGL